MKKAAVVIAICACSLLLLWMGALALRSGSTCLIETSDQAANHDVLVETLVVEQCGAGVDKTVGEAWINHECVHGMWRDHPGGGYYLKMRVVENAILPRKLSTSLPGIVLEGDSTGVYQAYMENLVLIDTLLIFSNTLAVDHDACDTIRILRKK